MSSSAKRKRGGGASSKKKTKRGPRVHYWVFTDNGEEGSKGAKLVPEAWKILPDGVRYLTWQYERADTGQLHLQGYVELLASQYEAWLHKNLSDTACYFVRRGSQEQASLYVHKENSRLEGPWELGQKKEGRQGERTDLESFRDAIGSGATLTMLKDTHLPQLAKYGRLYDRLKMLYRPVRREGSGPTVTLFIGLPGTGKTRSVFDTWELDPDFYELPSMRNGVLWIDGYDGHTKVLLDEFTGAGSRMDLDILLKLTDSYPRRQQVKGSFTFFNPKDIVITTNVHPKMWYDWSTRQAQYLALKRRIGEVWVFYELYKEPIFADDSFWWDEELNPKPSTVYKKDLLDYEKLLGIIWRSSHKKTGDCDHVNNYCVNNCKEKWNHKPWFKKYT